MRECPHFGRISAAFGPAPAGAMLAASIALASAAFVGAADESDPDYHGYFSVCAKVGVCKDQLTTCNGYTLGDRQCEYCTTPRGMQECVLTWSGDCRSWEDMTSLTGCGVDMRGTCSPSSCIPAGPVGTCIRPRCC